MKDQSQDVWAGVANSNDMYNAVNGSFEGDEIFPTDFFLLDKKKTYGRVLDFGCGFGRNWPVMAADEIVAYDLPEIINQIDDEIFKAHPTGLILMDDFDETLTLEYDLIYADFVFQFFFDREYFHYVLHKLAATSPYLHISSRCYAEGGWNVLAEIIAEGSWGVVSLNQDQDLLATQQPPSHVHFQGVFESNAWVGTKDEVVVNRQQDPFVYRSCTDLINDLYEGLESIKHDISGVCGLPRSGVVPAYLLSNILHVPLYSIEGLNHRLDFRPQTSRYLKEKPGRILILDDTSWTGNAMNKVKGMLHPEVKDQVLYGAVYASEKMAPKLDVVFKRMPSEHHAFEWNFMKEYLVQKYMVDMDGVLCEDWTAVLETPVQQEYLDFLENCKPYVQPAFPVYKVVTGRREQFRKETEAWLDKHNVSYNKLVMVGETHPNHAEGKAEVYANDSHAVLFVESCPVQAAHIYGKTMKPVFCLQTKQIYGDYKI